MGNKKTNNDGFGEKVVVNELPSVGHSSPTGHAGYELTSIGTVTIGNYVIDIKEHPAKAMNDKWFLHLSSTEDYVTFSIQKEDSDD